MKDRVAKHLGIKPEEIKELKIYSERGVVVCLVDKGIQGIPKHTIELSDLPELPKPAKTTKPELKPTGKVTPAKRSRSQSRKANR